MAFNVIDILLLLLVALSLLNGYRRGFILGVLDLAGWILSLLAGLRFYQPVARWLTVYVYSLPQIWGRPIAFVSIAVIVGFAVHLLGYAILKRLPKDIHQRRVNRLLGVIPGFANGLITAAIVSALLLVLCFFNSAVIWLLLDAEFLGIVLVLVYVGAVMVLFLFVVMMLDVNVEEFRKSLAGYWPLAVAVAGFVVFAIINVIVVKHLGGIALRTAPALPEHYSNTRTLGTALFTQYAYPAQVAACILLVASVAAIVLTLRRRIGGKPQDIAQQVAVRAKDRVRIVKMASEKRT